MVDPVSSTGGSQPPQLALNAAPKPSLTSAQSPTSVDVPRLVSMASQIAAEGPPVDYVKLAQISTAIFRGSYAINTTAIASAMSFEAYL